jgi:hypothetical protein
VHGVWALSNQDVKESRLFTTISIYLNSKYPILLVSAAIAMVISKVGALNTWYAVPKKCRGS